MEKISRIFHEYTQDCIRKGFQELNCLFIIRYSGIVSPAMSELRQSLKNCQARLFVAKNNTSRRVFDEMGMGELSKMLEGPCGIVFGKGDPVAVSKIIANFAKKNESLKIKGGILEKEILSQKQVLTMANLPTRDVLYAMVLGTLKSPFYGLAWTLGGIMKKFVNVLDQIKKAKGQR